jgi:GNAT superfamily N-acetyltransferase
MSVTIRNYQEPDKEQCRRLWRELVEWHREIYQNPQIGGDHPENFFDRHLSLVGNEGIWIAETDSKVIGFIGLIVKEDEAEIEPIIVSKSFRHKGVGRQLVETVIREAKKKKMKHLNVSPVARNIQAIEFFYRLGFVNIGHVNMFIDLSNQTWKPGFQMHDLEFRY